MTVKKRIIIALFTALALLSVIVFLYELMPQKSPQPTTEKINISNKQSNYRVKEYDGKIAVFIDGETTPLYTYDSPYVRDLPEYDRNILKEGIIAHNNSELLKILEDYDN